MDRYTKAVLTVIAVALSVIAIQGAAPSATAQMDGCGQAPSVACYVTNSPKDPIYVVVR